MKPNRNVEDCLWRRNPFLSTLCSSVELTDLLTITLHPNKQPLKEAGLEAGPSLGHSMLCNQSTWHTLLLSLVQTSLSQGIGLSKGHLNATCPHRVWASCQSLAEVVRSKAQCCSDVWLQPSSNETWKNHQGIAEKISHQKHLPVGCLLQQSSKVNAILRSPSRPHRLPLCSRRAQQGYVQAEDCTAFIKLTHSIRY